MASIRLLALGAALSTLAALGALSGCDSSGGTTPSPTQSAHAGFGGPATPPAVTDVKEAFFRTPSKNIVCALTPSEVRCDIAQNKWNLPTKPADCDFDWGNGVYLGPEKPTFTCASDSLLGSATQTLEYGTALRSGNVLCNSESTGLTCKNEKTTRGFTMSIARYSFF
ncbi:DUF6636 domain-containing protein [Actinoplanes sp. NPDC026619]|uniref:DUF6636 domain-containing protein n=1 Tax=Actinoplanes sp. NPDC026619 TaxID=3155798 RepID=UPI0033F1C53B